MVSSPESAAQRRLLTFTRAVWCCILGGNHIERVHGGCFRHSGAKVGSSYFLKGFRDEGLEMGDKLFLHSTTTALSSRDPPIHFCPLWYTLVFGPLL